MHEGAQIAVIVSPADCAKCRAREVQEFSDSHHAAAGKILGSLDNVLAEVVEGDHGFITEAFPEGVSAAAVNGCWQCHGTEVKVLANGTLIRDSSPTLCSGLHATDLFFSQEAIPRRPTCQRHSRDRGRLKDQSSR